MDAREEAQRILWDGYEMDEHTTIYAMKSQDYPNKLIVNLKERIAEALQRREKEAYERGKKDNNYCSGWTQGYNQAIDEAVRVAENLMIYTGPGGLDPEPYQKTIANEIGKLRKP